MYFYLSQSQYLLLGLIGGVIFLLVIVMAFFASRFGTRPLDPDDPPDVTHEFNDGLLEGNRPLPLLILFLAVIIFIWMAGYVIAVAKGWIHVQ